jgi:DNA-directed RNA polymerase specialized sigma24 family protein
VPDDDKVNTGDDGPRGRFPATRWSLIVASRRQPNDDAGAALASLCEIYWYPLYAYARRRGLALEDAQDLTQGFFAVLLEKNYLADFDPARGRFRSFLLGAFKHFLAKKHHRDRARKRGGGCPLLSLDSEDAERRYALDPAHGLTPEKIYDRRWALVLLDRALDRLRRESAPNGRFDRLSLFLTGDPPNVSYLLLGGELGISEGAAKVAVHRLRGRFRESLRAEIAETVAGPEQITEEMHFLVSAMSE